MNEQKQLADKIAELEKKVNVLAEGAIQTSAVIAAIEWSLIGKKIVTPEQLKKLYKKNLSLISEIENTPS